MARPGIVRRGLIASVVAGTLGCCLPVSASHTGEELTTDTQLVQSNDALIGALRQYESAPPAARSAIASQLGQLAAQRRERLLAALARNPNLAALRLLPATMRDRLPPAAQASVEQTVRMSGTVMAHVSDDFRRGVSAQHLFLQTDDGAAPHQLHAADPSIGEREMLGWAGRRVSVSAMKVDRHLILTSTNQVQNEAAGSTTTTTTTTTSTSSAVVQGDQKTLVILANFTDAAMSCTPADVATRLFGTTASTLNTLYQQSSRGAVSFSGQVVGPFNIPYSTGSACDYVGWGNAADAAAKAAGIDLTQFKRISYVTPISNTCNWSGMANMPGPRSWIQMCGATGVYAHELGHNLSLHHAATPTSEYGDASDPMGGARVVQHNAANRVMAGWLPAGSVADVTSGGSFAVSSLELTAPTSPQVLRFAKPDTKEQYYVSLRQAIDIDANLPASLQNAVTVHRSAGTLPAKTYLVQNLAVGQTFSDATNGIQVTLQGLAGNVATVGVGFGSGSCVRAAPLISASPTSQGGAAGATANYSVKVSNLNSAACASSTFSLSQALPQGFTGSVSAAAINIAPGSSATVAWSIGVPSTAAPGSYTFDLMAVESGSTSSTSVHTAYAVTMVDTIAPALTITTPWNGSTVGSRATIAADATDASGIQSVEFYVDGVLIARDAAAPFTATWNARKAAPGAHSIKVRAIDAAGNASEQTISVNR